MDQGDSTMDQSKSTVDQCDFTTEQDDLTSAQKLTSLIQRLPTELRQDIRKRVFSARQIIRRHLPSTRDPSVPPRDGSCPLLALPVETRRAILGEFLPANDRIVYPGSATVNPKSRTCDLLTLNKQLCAELTVVLYEERTFVINIHEGIFSGGVEFLNSGIQRLQYKQAFQQSVFRRFENGYFDFHRLKRIVFVIHPSKEPHSKTSRHDPMLTYFMITTMVALLNKKDDSGLNYLKVEFAEHNDDQEPDDEDDDDRSNRKAMRGESYWWNPELDAPRETSVHCMSNVELILRGFLPLHVAHEFDVLLPSRMRQHTTTLLFVARVADLLDPRNNWEEEAFDYDLEHQMEVSREALDDWVYQSLFGARADPDNDRWVGLGELVEGDAGEGVVVTKGKRHTAEEIEEMDEEGQMELAVRESLLDVPGGR